MYDLPQWFYPTEIILLSIAAILFIVRVVRALLKRRANKKDGKQS